MKISYNWLQSYTNGKLPDVKEVARQLTFHTFEVESIESAGDDWVLDVKVLPNRGHDALSHWSVAWEAAALNHLRLVPFLKKDLPRATSGRALSVKLEDPERCPRYTGRILEGVRLRETPAWMKTHLSAIGQRSINAAVDAANYVMFAVEQPMHVFDADKIAGDTIYIRRAKEGERMTTLDNKDVVLDPSVLVIADAEGPLAIAGIKGGKRAEVAAETKNIIIESANFHAASIRKTSQRLGIRTDASSRYEHELSAHLVEPAMKYLTELLLDSCGTEETKIGEIADAYPVPESSRQIVFTARDIERVLGTRLSEKEITEVLGQIGLGFKQDAEHFVIDVPPTRLDLRLAVDMTEEIGRFYGYDRIPAVPLERASDAKVNKALYYRALIRKLLAARGFSEVYNYSFVADGSNSTHVEIRNPLASDKKYLRIDLATNFRKRLEQNAAYADLLGLTQIRMFELGTVFSKHGEKTHLVIAVAPGENSKKSKKDAEAVFAEARAALGSALGVDIASCEATGDSQMLEINFDALLEKLAMPSAYTEVSAPHADPVYTPIPPYPFVTRDIALFVREADSPEGVAETLTKDMGALLVRTRLFDTFTKTFDDGSKKISYAFRFVFQSKERTLTSEEVDALMQKAYDTAKEKGWQVR